MLKKNNNVVMSYNLKQELIQKGITLKKENKIDVDFNIDDNLYKLADKHSYYLYKGNKNIQNTIIGNSKGIGYYLITDGGRFYRYGKKGNVRGLYTGQLIIEGDNIKEENVIFLPGLFLINEYLYGKLGKTKNIKIGYEKGPSLGILDIRNGEIIEVPGNIGGVEKNNIIKYFDIDKGKVIYGILLKNLMNKLTTKILLGEKVIFINKKYIFDEGYVPDKYYVLLSDIQYIKSFLSDEDLSIVQKILGDKNTKYVFLFEIDLKSGEVRLFKKDNIIFFGKKNRTKETNYIVFLKGYNINENIIKNYVLVFDKDKYLSYKEIGIDIDYYVHIVFELVYNESMGRIFSLSHFQIFSGSDNINHYITVSNSFKIEVYVLYTEKDGLKVNTFFRIGDKLSNVGLSLEENKGPKIIYLLENFHFLTTEFKNISSPVSKEIINGSKFLLKEIELKEEFYNSIRDIINTGDTDRDSSFNILNDIYNLYQNVKIGKNKKETINNFNYLRVANFYIGDLFIKNQNNLYFFTVEDNDIKVGKYIVIAATFNDNGKIKYSFKIIKYLYKTGVEKIKTYSGIDIGDNFAISSLQLLENRDIPVYGGRISPNVIEGLDGKDYILMYEPSGNEIDFYLMDIEQNKKYKSDEIKYLYNFLGLNKKEDLVGSYDIIGGNDNNSGYEIPTIKLKNKSKGKIQFIVKNINKIIASKIEKDKICDRYFSSIDNILGKIGDNILYYDNGVKNYNIKAGNISDLNYLNDYCFVGGYYHNETYYNLINKLGLTVGGNNVIYYVSLKNKLKKISGKFYEDINGHTILIENAMLLNSSIFSLGKKKYIEFMPIILDEDLKKQIGLNVKYLVNILFINKSNNDYYLIKNLGAEVWDTMNKIMKTLDDFLEIIQITNNTFIEKDNNKKKLQNKIEILKLIETF